MSSKPSKFQQWVEGHWYGRPGLLSLLSPFESLYKAVAASRRKTQSRAAQKYAVPVVVIGNISVGGTRKPPTIIALISFLHGKGLRVGVVSRGYGRITQGLVIANKTSATTEIGDEPYLIYHSAVCELAVCENRNDAVSALSNVNICDIILADDGLQHYSMYRDREIVVIDGARGVGNGRLLPVGPLRELPQRVDEVDWVLVNGAASSMPLLDTKTKVFNTRIAPVVFIQVVSGDSFPLTHFSGSNDLIAMAGLGNPQKFFDTLDELNLKFQEKTFKDHHAYDEEDFSDMAGKVILMTEKDAVKCKSLVGDSAFYLKVEMTLPKEFLEDFYSQINTLIKKN